MASKNLLFLVIFSLISFTLQDETDNKIDESPLADVAKQILKEKNLENIGGMVSSFLQSGEAKQVMDGVLQNLGSEGNSGQLLEGLASFLNSDGDKNAKDGKKAKKATKKRDGDVNPMDLLSGIGSIVGAMQGAGGEGGNPAALLQGLGSLLGGGNNQGEGSNTAALLQGLGSLMASASQEKGKKKSARNNGPDILQGLGSLLGAAAGNQGGDNNAGALLQGLGSLLGDGQGGINQEMIGNMINMFSSSGGDEKEKIKPSNGAYKKASSKNVKSKKAKSKKGNSNGLQSILSLAKSFLNKSKGKGDDLGLDPNLIIENFPFILKMVKSYGGPKVKPFLEPLDDILSLFNDASDGPKQFNFSDFLQKIFKIYQTYKELFAPYLKNLKSTGTSKEKDDSLGLESMLNIASSFLNQGDSDKGTASPGSSFMDYLPMILKTINAFTGSEAQERADSHAEHSWSLPPVLEKIHVYYDNFLNSEMGKNFVSFIGGQPTFTMFRDEKGNFNYTKFEELIENHSFRRHWIQQVVVQLVKLLEVLSDQKTYNQYIKMGITFTNSFLQNSDFPKDALIDPKKPAKSITNFANYAVKKYLDADFDTKEYVEPVVLYIQDLLKMAHKSISPGDQPNDLTDKLTNTINMEIIEPVTRVNRAYRFSKLQPQCDKYVFCLVNQEVRSYSENLPTLKKGIYKSTSLIAGWFISSHTGTPYWDLYSIVTDNKHCNDFYKEICSGFHEEEIKATTEYVHNEL